MMAQIVTEDAKLKSIHKIGYRFRNVFRNAWETQQLYNTFGLEQG